MLREFRRCPANYQDIILRKKTPPTATGFRIGRAFHKMLLEGNAAFRAAFKVAGPTNPLTGKSYSVESKAFSAWLDETRFDPQRIITPAEETLLGQMYLSVRRHREAAQLFAEGWPELSAQADFAALPCQIRLDWLRPDRQVVDLKTTSDLARFEGDARRLGYLHQFAFYREVARAAGAGDLEVIAVVVEKKAPFRTGLWKFTSAALAPYAAENLAALKSLQRCREENRWPTGYETVRAFPPAGIPKIWFN